MDLRKKLFKECTWSENTEFIQVFSIYSDDEWTIQNHQGFSKRCVAVSPQWVIRNLFDIKRASAILVSHNHPSNSEKFSFQDILFYKELKDICTALNIRLLDFVLKSENNIISIYQDSRVSHVSQHRGQKSIDLRGGTQGSGGYFDLMKKLKAYIKYQLKKAF